MNWRSIRQPVAGRLTTLRRKAPHEILGVSPSASEVEIKQAYRKQARAYHPDVVDPFLRPHGEQMMKLLNGAYQSMMARPRT
jgi:curved DNA-binding protein CbpA